MTDDDFKNLEHKLEKADEDLTAATKDVEALKKTQALILRALAEVPQFVQMPTGHGEPRDKAARHLGEFQKLLAEIARLTESSPS